MRRIVFFLITITIIQSLSAQKIKNKIAKNACECFSDFETNLNQLDSETILEKCLQPLILKYEKEIRKEYGDVFFDNPDSQIAREFGIQVGIILAQDCELFLKIITNQLQIKKKQTDSLFSEAENKMAQGAIDEAISLYSRAISEDSENFNYYNSRGIAFYKKEEYYKAIGDFNRALEIEPNNHIAYYNISYSMYNLGDMRSALDAINSAISMDESYCDSYNLKALIFDYQDKVDSSLTYFSLAYNCDSLNPVFNYNMGYANYRNKNWTEAIPFLIESYKTDTLDPTTISYIGICYNSIGDYQNAILYHTKSIKVSDTTDYIPYYNRALSYYNKEEFKLAFKDFYTAYCMDSTDIDVVEYLARSLSKTGNFHESLAYVNKLLARVTDNANYYDLRAHVYKNLGNYTAAINDYLVSLSLYPDDCKIHYYLGDLYTEIGFVEKAADSYEKSKSMGCE